MDYKKINELLKNINLFRHKHNMVYKEQTNIRDGYEGNYDERYEIYDANLEDDYLIKILFITDSYGDNESVSGIEFVKAKVTTTVIYES